VKNTDGSWGSEATFINDIEVWGSQAQPCAEHLTPGSLVFIEAHVEVDKWEDKTTGQKRSRLKVVSDDVKFLSLKKEA
jgi:single-strand DNA-binding protein